jgi:hypothetical protein
VARQVLHGERGLAGRGPPQAARLRPRPAELPDVLMTKIGGAYRSDL